MAHKPQEEIASTERGGTAASEVLRERLRRLPAIERIVQALSDVPQPIATVAARREVNALRERILAGEAIEPDPEAIAEAVRESAAEIARGSLRGVINATGVVLHTNLGRAPLAPEAAAAAAAIASGYSNLEYELATGGRGSRHSHIEPLLCELSGAEAAIATNNNAAAVLLALAAAAADREVIVGRGQLVEIGGGFRIPEVAAQSDARLVEVGTTNRTRITDYERAIGPDTAAIVRVHQSNFRTVGFSEEVPLSELCTLAREHGLALIDDLGSGALEEIGDEPTLRGSVSAGADLVCCSADKLLGGPQAGIIVGRGEAVARCRAYPLARAVRLDKLQLAALEATLRIHRDRGPGAIPALRMLAAAEGELRQRAERLCELAGRAATVELSTARPGGGTLPLSELAGPACVVDPGPIGAERLLERLRLADPPVIARIARGRVILDPRTMGDSEAELAGSAVREALGDDG